MKQGALIRRAVCSGLAAAILGLAQPAGAAQTGNVTVNGAVPVACDITVSAEAGASNIADISAGDTDRHIATVTESCNDPDGYRVTVAGANSTAHTGLFVDSVSSDTHPFTITYDSVPVPATGIVTDSNVPNVNLDKAVRITYGEDDSLTATAGFTYAETLTFTIAAK